MGRKIKAKDGPLKQPLTLAELAGHDDVCSDVMIDNAFYKFKIRKYRPKHIPVRGIKEEQIPQILLQHVIVGKDPVAAEKILLGLPGLKRYQNTLKNKSQKEHFIAHLRKYILMYQTDCAWEVSSTNRYTVTTYEAAVTARKRIRQGEVIKYLTGTLVPLTTEESLDLDITNRNFSIVVNNRKKSDQMFLGPARFANHDCDSNARLQMEGVDSMRVVATRNIAIGEEITVSYGDSYFGPDNVECLCSTCEANVHNGWTSKAAFTQPESGSSTPIPQLPTNSLSKKRKRDDSLSTLPRSVKKAKSVASPSKLQYSWTPPSTSESEVAIDELEGRGSAVPRAASRGVSEDRSATPQRDFKGRFLSSPTATTGEPSNSRGSKRASSKRRASVPLTPSTTSPSSQESETDNSSEQTYVQPVTIKVEHVEKVVLENDEPTDAAADTIEVVAASTLASTQQNNTPLPNGNNVFTPAASEPTLTSPPSSMTKLTMTKVSTVASIEPTLNLGEIPPHPGIIPSIEKPVASTPPVRATLSVHPVADTIRVPGDYVLTRRLLAQPHDRWVRCQNERCHGYFLQANGYQTRRECPRCERHSMLYGFPWPKTDPDPRTLLARQQGVRKKDAAALAAQFSAYRRQGRSGKGTWVEGGGDEEERVMDHRTIHRFVGPEEERELTRKGLLIAAETARKMGEDDLQGLRALDGSGRRDTSEGQDGREGTDETLVSEFLREEGVDGEGRRRSGRIVESRVYVNVDMKR
ncbi:uncharacterized protein HMPREF1541_05313 [Cyphellophora europaea CBS 101466]|uniref:Histone-lysine N-methyltransferase SET9 n=1 Tax=Cyphellophora europaea (strain CBS 101466) TaxID=1220924 RepID=W2RRE5_CYPE1|nr:uncharacterized protein HMPREF1541_05313 [Cyphellophora europaea CBS 101466]ETN39091.1 hypothetical protein HMPREF1541_05313 [Cyphellophora europaea CBS 101466]